MGIASSRTTDTGVFIKPTAETGWKEISLLQKGKERSSPLLNLMFLISRTRCFAFLLNSYLLFKDTSIGSHNTRAQSLRSAYYLTTITTTTIKQQPIVYEQRLITALLHFLSRLPGQSRCSESAERAWPLSLFPLQFQNRYPLFRHPIIPLCSEMAPRSEGQHDGYHSLFARPNRWTWIDVNINTSRESLSRRRDSGRCNNMPGELTVRRSTRLGLEACGKLVMVHDLRR
jgi:hypothetical protein